MRLIFSSGAFLYDLVMSIVITENTMANNNNINLQDIFLNHLRKSKAQVTLFLVNGVKLQGIITWFDNFSILLKRDSHSQLVYKHAISTVMPLAPVRLHEDEEDAHIVEE